MSEFDEVELSDIGLMNHEEGKSIKGFSDVSSIGKRANRSRYVGSSTMPTDQGAGSNELTIEDKR